MSSKILERLRSDPAIRKTFQDLLRYLGEMSSSPEDSLKPTSLIDDQQGMIFDQQLTVLTNLARAIDVQDNETKIGHWCTRENESKVRGMDSWFVYWLILKIDGAYYKSDNGFVAPEPYMLELTLWAVGKDDNSVQKAIKVWVENHFPDWNIEKLQCVRR